MSNHGNWVVRLLKTDSYSGRDLSSWATDLEDLISLRFDDNPFVNINSGGTVTGVDRAYIDNTENLDELQDTISNHPAIDHSGDFATDGALLLDGYNYEGDWLGRAQTGHGGPPGLGVGIISGDGAQLRILLHETLHLLDARHTDHEPYGIGNSTAMWSGPSDNCGWGYTPGGIYNVTTEVSSCTRESVRDHVRDVANRTD